MSEFTGERLIPGAVDADLWNEHISRYAFAASFCSGRERVLDAGCGTGYGSGFLSQFAGSVIGIDAAVDAVQFASRRYTNPATHFAVGSCEALPLSLQSTDLIVAFEVIEHLSGWRAFLEQCQAALSPQGALLVSTPNKQQYTESRGAAGPNPFHVHEFDFNEFKAELERLFLHVEIFGQNHAESIVFALRDNTGAKALLASPHSEPERAGYFLAVCSHQPIEALTNFVWVPESANILHQRERHIRLLRNELDDKDKELSRTRATHAALVSTHRRTIAELERSNAWAESLNARILQLQGEVETGTNWALSLDREVRERSDRVVELQQQLADEQTRASEAIVRLEAELQSGNARACKVIDDLHMELDARTAWARGLDTEIAVARHAVEQAQAELRRVKESHWGKAGRALRLVHFAE